MASTTVGKTLKFIPDIGYKSPLPSSVTLRDLRKSKTNIFGLSTKLTLLVSNQKDKKDIIAYNAQYQFD